MEKERLAEYLERYHLGAANAATSWELECAFGVRGKDLRDAVNGLRRQGVPIASNGNGYFYAATEQEVLGKPIEMRRVRELAGGAIARPHIARALLEAGHVTSVSDAFDRFLKPGKPAYVPKDDVKVAEAVRLIAQAGGVAVLAHPMELKLGETQLQSLIGEWKAQGLAGVEAFHPSAQNNHAAFLLRMARREGLLVTGGSDFHGEAVRKTEIGEGLDRWTTMEDDVQALMASIRSAGQTR